jgi:hypothetical protein
VHVRWLAGLVSHSTALPPPPSPGAGGRARPRCLRGRRGPRRSAGPTPPPSLSTTTSVQSGRWLRRASRPLVSWRNARSPSSAIVGPPDPNATPTAVETTPSMPFAPRLAWRRAPRTPNHSTSRIGIDEDTTSSACRSRAAALTIRAAAGSVSGPAHTSRSSTPSTSSAASTQHRYQAAGAPTVTCSTRSSTQPAGCAVTRSSSEPPGSNRRPQRSTPTWYASRPSSHCPTTFDAGSAPRRTTTSGRAACAKSGTRSRASAVAIPDPQGIRGSNSTGHCMRSQDESSRSASVPMGGPATTSVLAPSIRATSDEAGGSCRGGPNPVEPSVGGSGPGLPSSGSRNGRFSCTGPGACPTSPGVPPVADDHAARARPRQPEGSDPSGGPRSRKRRTAPPYNRCWSIVCGAPTPWSSGGRSAVHAMIGTRSWWASTTAGCRFTAAVPLVVSTGTGRPVTRAMPSATNPADRSSRQTCTWTPSARSNATANGVERDPGHTTACSRPQRRHSSTRVAQNVAAAFDVASGGMGQEA